jgi:hypothetical protein
VVGPHAGSAGSVQEQSGFVLQFVTTDFLHLLRSMPDKPAHAALISSAQVLFVHFPAALASETKTPAASATAADATTALLVIVEPPYTEISQMAGLKPGSCRGVARVGLARQTISGPS